MEFLHAYLTILISMNAAGILLFMMFFISSCSLLKQWTINIIVILIAAVHVCNSFTDTIVEIILQPTYLSLEHSRALGVLFAQVYPVITWLKPLGTISNLLSLAYALQRYIIICKSAKFPKCHILLQVVYVIIAVLVKYILSLDELGVTFSTTLVSSEISNDVSLKTRHSIFSITFFLDLCLMVSVSVFHALLVVAMNKRLDTSIVLLKSLKKHKTVKNCAKIKMFNVSSLVLQFAHNLMKMLFEFIHATGSLLLIYDVRFINWPLIDKTQQIVRLVKLFESAASQVLFPVFHFIYLPKFLKFLKRNCGHTTQFSG